MIQSNTLTDDLGTTLRRRDVLRSLGKWSRAVIIGVICGEMMPARAVNWNDCRNNDSWLNSSGSGGHWINSYDSETRLQGGDSGNPPRDGKPRGRPWLNGNRDGWTNRQGCGGTWVNF